MTQTLAIPPALAGMAIFVPKLFWGIVCDLGIGVAADRLRAKYALSTFLLAGAILAPIALILLFTPPDPAASVQDKALHVSLMLAFYMAAFAVFSVPHLSIGAELTRDPRETSTIMGWRIAFSAVGIIVASSLAPVYAQSNGYQAMALLLAIIAAIALIISFFASPAASPVQNETKLDLRSGLKDVWANKGFLLLFLAFLLTLTASGLAYATWLYLLTFNLAFPQPLVAVGIVGLCISACVMLAQPFWVYVTGKIGRRSVFMLAMILYSLALIAFALLPQNNLPLAIAAGMLMGVGNSGGYQSAFAMLADRIEEDRVRTGSAKGGLYSALWVINDKIAFALGGTLIAGFILGAFGFQAGQGVAQTEHAKTGIAIAFAVLPTLLNAAAFLCMMLYKEPALKPASGS
jgi:GPH family glycoside/pentoside/hexuronide:cation symporter